MCHLRLGSVYDNRLEHMEPTKLILARKTNVVLEYSVEAESIGEGIIEVAGWGNFSTAGILFIFSRHVRFLLHTVPSYTERQLTVTGTS